MVFNETFRDMNSLLVIVIGVDHVCVCLFALLGGGEGDVIQHNFRIYSYFASSVIFFCNGGLNGYASNHSADTAESLTPL